MELPPEPELISRAAAGDKPAFEDLLRPVIVPAARLAYGMLQDRAEAEDVVQESAVKAWHKLGNLRPGASSPTSAAPCGEARGGLSFGCRALPL